MPQNIPSWGLVSKRCQSNVQNKTITISLSQQTIPEPYIFLSTADTGISMYSDHYMFVSLPSQPAQSSQTALLRSSPILFSSSLSRFSLSRLFLSLSNAALSIARCSSVRLGARTPSAPAISRSAVRVVFSGRRVAVTDEEEAEAEAEPKSLVFSETCSKQGCI